MACVSHAKLPPLIGRFRLCFRSDFWMCYFFPTKKWWKLESDLKIDIQISISSIYTYWKVITVESSFQLKDFPVECLFLGDGLTRWCLETIMGTRPRNPPKIGWDGKSYLTWQVEMIGWYDLVMTLVASFHRIHMFGLSSAWVGASNSWGPPNHPVMDAHDLVLKPMVTWGSPIKTGAWRIWQRLHPGILSEPLQGGRCWNLTPCAYSFILTCSNIEFLFT